MSSCKTGIGRVCEEYHRNEQHAYNLLGVDHQSNSKDFEMLAKNVQAAIQTCADGAKSKRVGILFTRSLALRRAVILHHDALGENTFDTQELRRTHLHVERKMASWSDQTFNKAVQYGQATRQEKKAQLEEAARWTRTHFGKDIILPAIPRDGTDPLTQRLDGSATPPRSTTPENLYTSHQFPRGERLQPTESWRSTPRVTRSQSDPFPQTQKFWRPSPETPPPPAPVKPLQTSSGAWKPSGKWTKKTGRAATI